MNLQEVSSVATPQSARIESAGQTSRVLRNTYLLLALSMVSTVLGAWLGLAVDVASLMTPGMGLIAFLAGAFAFMFAIERNKDSPAGVAFLLAFTLFMGFMLARLLGSVLGLLNGASIVMLAFAGTAAVFVGMATLSSVIQRDLTALGKWLFVGGVMLLVASIANFFVQSGVLLLTVAVLAIGVFSAFILHDLKRVRDGLETNYIVATLGVYLSIYNVFQALLIVLGLGAGGEE